MEGEVRSITEDGEAALVKTSERSFWLVPVSAILSVGDRTLAEGQVVRFDDQQARKLTLEELMRRHAEMRLERISDGKEIDALLKSIPPPGLPSKEV